MNSDFVRLSARRPIICLVTDRRRLSPGAVLDRQLNDLIALVVAAVKAGIEIVQVRERDLSRRKLKSLVARCVEASGDSGTRVVVNDGADVALATGAAGVHLREDSIASERVRTLGGHNWLLSRALHDPSKVPGKSSTLDYMLFGTVFPTASKGVGCPLGGLGGLREATKRAHVPVLAIGGVTESRLEDLWRAGAAGIAGIGLFIESAQLNFDWAVGLTGLVRRVRRSFDTV